MEEGYPFETSTDDKCFFSSEIAMALFYGQNIKCKYITVMLYISMSCCIHRCYVCIYQCHVVYINVMFVYINVMLYTSMLCLYISMWCCIINVISKAYTSVLYAVNRVLYVTNRCCLLYIFLAMWHQDQTSEVLFESPVSIHP